MAVGPIITGGLNYTPSKVITLGYAATTPALSIASITFVISVRSMTITIR